MALKIFTKTLNGLDWKLTQEIITIIAHHCCNIPRIIINNIKQIHSYCLAMNLQLNESNILNILSFLQIYPLGLNITQLTYLLLFNKTNINKSLSIETISQLLNEEVKNIEIHYEPLLIKHGLIAKTTQGRKITKIGQDYLINNRKLFK